MQTPGDEDLAWRLKEVNEAGTFWQQKSVLAASAAVAGGWEAA